jgi:hypothetical protein
MGEIAIKLAWGILSKLVTETFAARMIVYSLDAVAEKTTNKLDDKMVAAVADALGIAVPKQ